MNIERLRAIYPTFTDKELREAAQNLRRYFECVLQIATGAHGVLVDKSDHPVTIRERSSSSLNNFPSEHG